MTQKRETPALATRATSDFIRLAGPNGRGFSASLRDLQARRLERQFGLTPTWAAVVAELAFTGQVSR